MTRAYIHSDRLARAFDYAAICHAAQRRKGTDIPYLSHLIGVASLVMEAAGEERDGADLEDLVIAGLLHDAVEDHGGEPRREDIESRFGPRVAEIVDACSDAAPTAGEEKAPWSTRKMAYLEHLSHSEDAGALLVSAADKVHNARAILSDLRVFRARGHDQREFWKRFLKKKPEAEYPDRINEILWYYRALADVFKRKTDSANSEGLKRLSLELTAAVDEIERVADEAGLKPVAPVEARTLA